MNTHNNAWNGTIAATANTISAGNKPTRSNAIISGGASDGSNGNDENAAG